jgi:acyl carrier protein
MPPDNEAKLKRTIAGVLGIPDTVEAWDSLKHLNLVLALEEQFGVSLTEEQSFEILNYPLIKTVLAEHGIEFAA